MIWVLVIAAMAVVITGSRLFADWLCGAALFGGLIALVRFDWGALVTCILVFCAAFLLIYRQEVP